MSLFRLWVALGVTIFVVLVVLGIFDGSWERSDDAVDFFGVLFLVLVASAFLAGLVVGVVAVWRWA